MFLEDPKQNMLSPLLGILFSQTSFKYSFKCYFVCDLFPNNLDKQQSLYYFIFPHSTYLSLVYYIFIGLLVFSSLLLLQCLLCEFRDFVCFVYCCISKHLQIIESQ